MVTKLAMKDIQIGDQLRHKSCKQAAKWYAQSAPQVWCSITAKPCCQNHQEQQCAQSAGLMHGLPGKLITKRPLRCSTMMALSRISSLQRCDRCRTRGFCSGCRLLRLSNSPWMACSGIASRLKSLCSISSAVCYIKYRAYDCSSTCAIMIWSLLLLPYQPVDREEWHVFGLCIATSMLDCASCMSLISSHAFTLKTNHRHVSTGSLVVPAQEVLLWWQHDKCRAAVTQHSPARG